MENTNNSINKPISLIIEESKQTIVNAINNTGLPMTLLEMVMRDLYNEVRQKALYQYESEKNEYERALAEQMKAKETNEIQETKEATEK